MARSSWYFAVSSPVTMAGPRFRQGEDGSYDRFGRVAPAVSKATISPFLSRAERGGRRPEVRAVAALRALASFLFVVCIPVALLTSTIRYIANEPRIYTY